MVGSERGRISYWRVVPAPAVGRYGPGRADSGSDLARQGRPGGGH